MLVFGSFFLVLANGARTRTKQAPKKKAPKTNRHQLHPVTDV